MMGWIVWTVLSLCLPAWSAVKVTQPYRVVSSNGTAQIQCFVQPSHNLNLPSPNSDPEELRVALLKGLHGTQEVCSLILSFPEQKEKHVQQEGTVQCSAQPTDGAVEVTVSGLKATDTDMYRCEIQVFYPPPYLRLTGNGTLIHVLDSSGCPAQEAQRQTARQGEEEEDDEREERKESVSVPVVVLVIVVICVLVMIIYLQIPPCERGRREAVRTLPVVLQKADAASFPPENMA